MRRPAASVRQDRSPPAATRARQITVAMCNGHRASCTFDPAQHQVAGQADRPPSRAAAAARPPTGGPARGRGAAPARIAWPKGSMSSTRGPCVTGAAAVPGRGCANAGAHSSTEKYQSSADASTSPKCFFSTGPMKNSATIISVLEHAGQHVGDVQAEGHPEQRSRSALVSQRNGDARDLEAAHHQHRRAQQRSRPAATGACRSAARGARPAR